MNKFAHLWMYLIFIIFFFGNIGKVKIVPNESTNSKRNCTFFLLIVDICIKTLTTFKELTIGLHTRHAYKFTTDGI